MSPRPKADAAGGIAGGIAGDFTGGFSDFRVRPAGPFDIPVIAGLHADSVAGVLAGQVWNETAVAEVLSMPGAYGLLAVPSEGLSAAKNSAAKDTGPAGFLLGCTVAGSSEIVSLGTARAWRRRGVAWALLRAAIDHAAAAGVSRLFLKVAEDNVAARDLYAGAGFARIARRPAYYTRPDGPAASALVLAYDLA